MEHWYTSSARTANPDAIRQWSNAEGKSATTRDDLYRSYSQQGPSPGRKFAGLALIAELFLALANLWLQIRRR
jgi:hypothetical protein